MKWQSKPAFGYNPRSELTSAQMDANQFSYLYDSIGNRKEASANAVTNFYTANELNQYTEIDSGNLVEPEYGVDGNLTRARNWAYAWDAENRLVRAQYVGVHYDAPTISFGYDYMGRMTSRQYYQKMRPHSTPHNEYLYDGWNRIRERAWIGFESEAENISTDYWVWGFDLSRTLQGAGGIGGLLAEITPDVVRYPFCDGNGNIMDWVDGEGGLIAHHEYDPYGNESTDNLPSSYGFSSKPFDSTLGLYYYGYRFYRPDWGRWINRDIISELKGIGLYLMLDNGPMDAFDVLGLFKSKANDAEAECRDWITDELLDMDWLDNLPDCPCELEPCGDSWKKPDGNWSKPGQNNHHPGSSACIRSTNNEGGAGQQCCYDGDGNLIKDGPGAGTPDRVSPEGPIDTLRHYFADVEMFDYCMKNMGAAWLDAYLAVRPPNQGVGGCP